MLLLRLAVVEIVLSVGFEQLRLLLRAGLHTRLRMLVETLPGCLGLQLLYCLFLAHLVVLLLLAHLI